MKKAISPFIILGGMLLNGCFIRDLLFDPVDPRDKLKMSNLIDVASKYKADSEVSNRTEKKKVSDIYNEVYEKLEFKQFGEKVEYSKRLPAPATEATSIDEVSRIFDYYAFYGDGKPFEIKLPSNVPQKQASQVFHTSFYKSKLCSSTTGLNYEYQAKGKKYVLQLLYNSEANSYKVKDVATKTMSLPYSFPTNNGDRAEDFTQFPYLTKNTKDEVTVYNSEQLLYVLEHGYKPVPVSESPAEVLFNYCKETLKKIIKNDMTEIDKITAIYSYVISHSVYDSLSDTNSTYTVEEVNFPDFIASSFRSYYAEGALIDGCSNSHGLAKAFNILANIEGINSLKVTSRFNDDTAGINSINYSDEGALYSNTGYCYVYNSADKKYYIVDPSYSMYTTASISDINYSLYRKPCIMYPFDKWSALYEKITDRYFESYKKAEALGTDQVFTAANYKIGASYNLLVNNYSDLGNYVRDVISYMKDQNTDTSYKTNEALYQLNITINELETELTNNPDYLSDSNNVSSVNSSINNRLSSYTSTIAYRASVDFYSAQDTGLILILKYT